jgi:hypothetical protein
MVCQTHHNIAIKSQCGEDCDGDNPLVGEEEREAARKRVFDPMLTDNQLMLRKLDQKLIGIADLKIDR